MNNKNERMTEALKGMALQTMFIRPRVKYDENGISVDFETYLNGSFMEGSYESCIPMQVFTPEEIKDLVKDEVKTWYTEECQAAQRFYKKHKEGNEQKQA